MTGLSKASRGSKFNPKLNVDAAKRIDPAKTIAEEQNEEEATAPHMAEANPDDFKVCNVCSNPLNEDERIINARFVTQANAMGQDTSIFPICVKCNFE